jgi:hypothetical protein
MTFLYFVALQYFWRLLKITTANCSRKLVCAFLITTGTSIQLRHVNTRIDTQENYLQVKVQGQHLVHGGCGKTVAVCDV